MVRVVSISLVQQKAGIHSRCRLLRMSNENKSQGPRLVQADDQIDEFR